MPLSKESAKSGRESGVEIGGKDVMVGGMISVGGKVGTGGVSEGGI